MNYEYQDKVGYIEPGTGYELPETFFIKTNQESFLSDFVLVSADWMNLSDIAEISLGQFYDVIWQLFHVVNFFLEYQFKF